MNVELMEARDRHYSWMLGLARAPLGLRLPPGGVEDPDIITMLRDLTAGLKRAGCRSSWLIVSGREVVGLCSFKQVPDADGAVEFGYGIAASRRGCGYGTAAVAAMMKKVKRNRSVRCLVAETVVGNIASHRILEHNGFVRTGTCIDAEDGLLIVWQRTLYPQRRLLAVILASWAFKVRAEMARIAIWSR